MKSKTKTAYQNNRRAAFLLFAFCFLLFFSACTSPKTEHNPVLQPEITLLVEAQPQTVPADGSSRMVVFVELRHGSDAVADSTEIILLNTKGTLGKGILYTHSGAALDTLTSDTTSGAGWLIACAEGLRDSAAIIFTARP
ncbi:MAG TPA: hypothetical protein VGL38_07200 [bacterium]|jgi:predicted component of type VI protein secretion system